MGDRQFLGEFEQLVLLALVRLQGNAYGVTIRRELVERTKRDVSLGAVYATLSRLAEKGFVESSVGEPTPERGGRAKKFFSVTAPGLVALDETRQVQNRMWDGVVLEGV